MTVINFDSERRKSQRQTVNIEVSLLEGIRELFVMRALNISSKGMYVLCEVNSRLAIGTIVDASFYQGAVKGNKVRKKMLVTRADRKGIGLRFL